MRRACFATLVPLPRKEHSDPEARLSEGGLSLSSSGNAKLLLPPWPEPEKLPGMSALGLQRALGLGNYKTVWAILHKLRRATGG